MSKVGSTSLSHGTRLVSRFLGGKHLATCGFLLWRHSLPALWRTEEGSKENAAPIHLRGRDPFRAGGRRSMLACII